MITTYDCHCDDDVEFLLEPNIIADLITASITTPHKNCRRGVPRRRRGGEDGGAAQGRAAVNLIKVYGGGQFVEIERDLGEDF